MKVFLVAYALSPSLGSEAAIGWGWASGLARVHDVTVVSREKHRDEVISYLKEHPELKISFQWIASGVEPGPIWGSSTYLAWLRRAVKLCRELTARESFDVVHHVSYGTISVPVDLWDCGIPFVLGPVGGGQKLNPMYQEVLGTMPMEARLRNLRVALLQYWPPIRSMLRNSALVLTSNRETARLASRCGGRTELFSDTGIKEEFLLEEPILRPQHGGLRMLWAGRMLYRKGIPIILHAMKLSGREDFTLDLLGAGPMESKWRAEARKLGLEKQVTFHGHVPFAQVFDFYDRADLFVFPSVNDSLGSQLLEAACRGLPILTLNHQGAGALLPDTVAWKVSVDTVKNTVNGMAEAMVTLAESRERLSAMSKAAIQYAHTESWPRRIVRMSKLYEQLLSTATAESRLSGGECLS
jgi:glycosyltransferase involved in cell wall biosynthesis